MNRSWPLLVCAGMVAVATVRAKPEVSDSALKLGGIFNTNLPGTEGRHSLRLLLHPHMGDLSRRNTLRAPMGLRYGLTDNWEMVGELETFFSHGLKNERLFERAGFSQTHLGTKYRFGRRLLDAWDGAVGVDYTRPLGNPPAEVTDGLEHFTAFLSFARPWAEHPGVRFFWGVSADLINRTGVSGRLEKNQLGDDSVGLNGGLVWKRGRFHYTLEAAWATSDRIGGPVNGNVVTVRPGFVWEVPREYTLYSNGQWLLGGGFRVSEGPDGVDLGAGVKVRVNFDLKRFLRTAFSNR